MLYVITDRCAETKDGACIDVCPVDAIAPANAGPERDKAPQLFINPDACIGCGLCEVECPVDAIRGADDLTGDDRRFIDLNAAWFSA